MATIQENLNTLSNIKADIKTSIINKGVDAGDDITLYGDKIREISGGEVDDADYLCFEALGNGEIYSKGSKTPNIEYSFDKQSWTTWNYAAISLTAGLKVYFRGNNPTGFSDSGSLRSFMFSGCLFKASGNIMSLIDGIGQTKEIPNTYCFYALFDVSGTPVSTHTAGLINAPKMPATILKDYCYGIMFNQHLTLEVPPELPATELKPSCYRGMFLFCSIKEAPYLPAKTLVNECYRSMFYACKNIQYVRAEFTNTIGAGYTTGWLNSETSGVNMSIVPSTGCFIKAKSASWSTQYGNNYIPTGWTVVTSVN